MLSGYDLSQQGRTKQNAQMTPQQFIATWQGNSLSEKGGAQPHFEDLCKLLGVAPPRQAGEYCYEQGLDKAVGGKGFADVWKRGCFAWENKGPTKDLKPALMQLKNYAGALDNPPVLVVCNRERIELHPCFTGYPSTPRIIPLQDIGHPEHLQSLRWLFSEGDIHRLRPVKSNAAITAEAAGEFATVAKSLRGRGIDSQRVAHFLIQCIFCMYAEDEGLLHRGATEEPHIFTGILKGAKDDTDKAARRITSLFEAMQKKNGQYGNDDIAWFNGGLFKTIDVPPLTVQDLTALREAADTLDWRAIDPTIFGTLFERGLDPSARAPLGAHYTDTETIQKLIRPMISEPLAAEWEAAKVAMEAGRGKGKRSDANKAAVGAYQGHLERLRNFKVLDPACGSGNFLYMAMRALKDLEHKAQIDAELMGFDRQIGIETGPSNILGLEVNEYAAELARVTVWIGDIQWSQANGRPIADNPILRALDTIEHRDALMNADGSETEWPEADVIVGNPPFLGGSKKSGELGRAYCDALNKVYEPWVPGGADLVCYWFHKARLHIQAGKVRRVGLVSTNSIRGGANRKVLDAITDELRIFNAWADEPWINDGAAVRVSLVCFGAGSDARLNGLDVPQIYADLTAPTTAGDSLNLSKAQPLPENLAASFQGASKKAKFEIDAELAREWLLQPNPHGRPNSDVLKPWANGFELSRGPQHQWIIDFGIEMPEADAALYELPFAYVTEHIKAERLQNNRESYRKYWWRFAEPRPGLRQALKSLQRFIGTVAHSKHRFFVWLPIATSPDQALITVARADDATFGILHSRLHELWALRMGTSLEDRPRYTPSTTFETFPFPEGLTPADTRGHAQPEGDVQLPPVAAAHLPAARAIATAAQRLHALRENWLNPTEWVERVPEVVPGYPDRIVPKPAHAAELKKRTMTNLYNTRPVWLDIAHKALNAAVAQAYGWADYTPEMPDDEILRRLLALNLARAAAEPTAEG
jgi:hypothetical protein